MDQQDTFSLQAGLLPEGINRKYGYDFRGYQDKGIAALFLRNLLTTVTDILREQVFCRPLRKNIMPILKTSTPRPGATFSISTPHT